MPKRILIVDDNPRIRESLRDYLQGETEFEVCGEAVDGLDGMRMAETVKPDLIILDLQMPNMNGLDAAPRLKRVLPNVPIVLFTMHKDALSLPSAFACGVDAVFGDRLLSPNWIQRNV